MVVRFVIVAALVGVASLLLWHPAPRGAIVALTPSPAVTDAPKRRAHTAEVVVYVTGAVRRPGLYPLHEGDRYDRAVTLAGGFRADADATGVNLAQRAADGDEVLVPRAGEATYRRNGHSRSPRAPRRHRRKASAPAEGSVNVNDAASEELARVPGVGRAIAGRIVELREREGAFASLDELLDVAGMTQSRLARARPYLQEIGGAEVSPH